MKSQGCWTPEAIHQRMQVWLVENNPVKMKERHVVGELLDI
jgi:hypothetical protein